MVFIAFEEQRQFAPAPALGGNNGRWILRCSGVLNEKCCGLDARDRVRERASARLLELLPRSGRPRRIRFD